MREVALDQARQQHVAERDRGPAGGRPGQQGGEVPGAPGVQGAQQQPRGQHRHGAEQHAFGAEAAGEHGGQRGEDAEQRDGHRGEDHHRPARQPGVGRHLGKHRRETGEHGAEVQPDQDQAESQIDQPAAAADAGGRGGGDIVDLGVDQRAGAVPGCEAAPEGGVRGVLR